MSTENVAGFWSYAHEDNELDGGAILNVARHLSEEYNLLSGEPLELFVDRDGIAWGDHWREQIDSALSRTTFLIPIITPRYFTRRECRRELLEFIGKAKSFGVEELLLPILYVEVPDFSPENTDEAVALVAQTQYVDWREIRLIEPTSREYRTAINSLALQLLTISRDVAARQLDQEVDAGSEDNGADGVADLIAKMAPTLSEWLDIVQGERVNYAQIDATWHHVFTPILKLQRAHAPASAILASQTRAAREFLPLAERAQSDWRTYLAASVKLDPLISALARLVSEHPESFDLAMPIRAAIDEAMKEIRQHDEEMKEPGAHTIVKHFDEMKHLGRLFQRCYVVATDAERAKTEADTIVRRWDTELRRSSDPDESEASPSIS